MLCPDCNTNISSTTLKTDTGDIILDYCTNCGGVWADQGEVNFIKEKDIEPLKKLVPQVPLEVYSPTHLCPTDRNRLQLLQSESIPTGLDVFHCNICGGIWFPKDTLFTFKTAQQAKLTYFKTWNIPLHSIYAILLPMLLIAVVGGGILVTYVGFKQGADVRTRAEDVMSTPRVNYPKPDEVLISFTTKQAVMTKIKYWIAPDLVTEVWVSDLPQTTHTIVLKNVEPNKSYSYQVILIELVPVTSPVYVFSTKAK